MSGAVASSSGMAQIPGRSHRKGLDKEFFRGIIAYVDSLYQFRPGHFPSRSSVVEKQGSSMKNEGCSCDVVENT
jgi:hypothetical protein